jgi:hypothetical protein
MSFNFKINKKDFKKLKEKIESIDKVITRQVAVNLGYAVKTQMLVMIEKGISPIRQNGRFPGYKRARYEDGYPKNIVDKYPNKKIRPINLWLSGDFLKSLTFMAIAVNGSFKARIFFNKELSNKKESGHREGVNGQPSRPTIPIIDKGEAFAVSIQKKIIDIITAQVKKIINS